MSRTINPAGPLPPPGSSLSVGFASFTRPISGDWVVQVTMRATSSPAGKAYIQVVQGGRILASSLVDASTSYTTYSLTVPEAALQDVAQGLCDISGVAVTVSGTVVASCCPGVELPKSLSVSLTCATCHDPLQAGCPCWTNFSMFVSYDDSQSAWIGSGVVPGCNAAVTLILKCDGGSWSLRLIDCQTEFLAIPPFSSSCDPFSLIFGNGIVGGVAISTLCCGTPSGSSVPLQAVVTL